jgi:hypothetical protein
MIFNAKSIQLVNKGDNTSNLLVGGFKPRMDALRWCFSAGMATTVILAGWYWHRRTSSEFDFIKSTGKFALDS